MARIRNIKPEFFTSEAVSELPLRARLTWIGLWVHCDNHGRARDNVRVIKGAVWPLDDVSLKDIEDDLSTLAEHRRIVRYVVDGKRYLVVTNWGEHQYGAFKGDPKYPAPPDDSGSGIDISGSDREKFDGIQGSGVRGQGGGTREGATPPPPRCSNHLETPASSPCGPCKDARLARGQWETERAEKLRAERDAVRACDLCDGDGYRYEQGHRIVTTPYIRCDHRAHLEAVS